MSSEEAIRAALFGGVPGDKWKEGLLFEGIRPMPWLASAAFSALPVSPWLASAVFRTSSIPVPRLVVSPVPVAPYLWQYC